MIADRGNVHPLPRQAAVECVRFHAINKGSLVGFCDLVIEGWHLMLIDCAWFRSAKGEWISLPSTSYTAHDGKKRYKRMVEFTDEEAGRRFGSAALAAVQQFAARGGAS